MTIKINENGDLVRVVYATVIWCGSKQKVQVAEHLIAPADEVQTLLDEIPETGE